MHVKAKSTRQKMFASQVRAIEQRAQEIARQAAEAKARENAARVAASVEAATQRAVQTAEAAQQNTIDSNNLWPYYASYIEQLASGTQTPTAVEWANARPRIDALWPQLWPQASDDDLMTAWEQARTFQSVSDNGSKSGGAALRYFYEQIVQQAAERAGFANAAAWRDSVLQSARAAPDYDAFASKIESASPVVRQLMLQENGGGLGWNAGTADAGWSANGEQFNALAANAALARVEEETRDAELRKWAASSKPFVTAEVGQRAEEKLALPATNNARPPKNQPAEANKPNGNQNNEGNGLLSQLWFQITVVALAIVFVIVIVAVIVRAATASKPARQQPFASNIA